MEYFPKRGCTSSFYKQRRQSFSLWQTLNFFFFFFLHRLKSKACCLSCGGWKEKVETRRGPDLSEGSESAQSLLPLLIHPLLPLLLLLFSLLTFLQQTTEGDTERHQKQGLDPGFFWCSCQFGRIPLGCLAAIEIVPGGSDGAGWRGWSFARLATSSAPEPPHTGPGKYTKNTETSIVNAKTQLEVDTGQTSSLKSKKAIKWIVEDGFKFWKRSILQHNK